MAAKLDIGDIIQGTGGIRKMRFALANRGKSGGSRVIYFYHNIDTPLFLLDIYTKNKKENLSKEERNNFMKLTSILKNYKGRENG